MSRAYARTPASSSTGAPKYPLNDETVQACGRPSPVSGMHQSPGQGALKEMVPPCYHMRRGMTIPEGLLENPLTQLGGQVTRCRAPRSVDGPGPVTFA